MDLLHFRVAQVLGARDDAGPAAWRRGNARGINLHTEGALDPLGIATCDRSGDVAVLGDAVSGAGEDQRAGGEDGHDEFPGARGHEDLLCVMPMDNSAIDPAAPS